MPCSSGFISTKERRLFDCKFSSDTSKGELDFLLQKEICIIPVEVKAEENLQSKSLRSFVEKNPELHGIRFSMSDYREQEWLTNYPLYSAGHIL